MNKPKNMKIFFNIFTFEEEDSNTRHENKRRKKKRQFWVWDIFSPRKNFGIFNLYIRNWNMTENIITVTLEWVQQDLVISCPWFKREFRRETLDFERVSRSIHPEAFLRKDVLKIHSKFTGDHPCWNAISIKLQGNFIEIALRHGCSPINLLYIFRTSSLTNTSGRLLLSLKAPENISSKFEELSNFTHVLGAIDGKHTRIESTRIWDTLSQL